MTKWSGMNSVRPAKPGPLPRPCPTNCSDTIGVTRVAPALLYPWSLAISADTERPTQLRQGGYDRVLLTATRALSSSEPRRP